MIIRPFCFPFDIFSTIIAPSQPGMWRVPQLLGRYIAPTARDSGGSNPYQFQPPVGRASPAGRGLHREWRAAERPEGDAPVRYSENGVGAISERLGYRAHLTRLPSHQRHHLPMIAERTRRGPPYRTHPSDGVGSFASRPRIADRAPQNAQSYDPARGSFHENSRPIFLTDYHQHPPHPAGSRRRSRRAPVRRQGGLPCCSIRGHSLIWFGRRSCPVRHSRPPRRSPGSSTSDGQCRVHTGPQALPVSSSTSADVPNLRRCVLIRVSKNRGTAQPGRPLPGGPTKMQPGSQNAVLYSS